MNIEQRIQTNVSTMLGQQAIHIATLTAQLDEANETIASLSAEVDGLRKKAAKASKSTD